MVKTLAQSDEELAREIIRTLGYEFYADIDAVAPVGIAAVATRPGVRAGRREGDQPAYVSLEQLQDVKGLLANYRLELETR